jgi:hypothetical protein
MGIVLPMKNNREAAQRAERLRRIRERLHEIPNQAQFAAQLRVPYNTYNNWERGHPIPVNEAKRIRDITPGITGDYILWGIEDGLTIEIARKLRQKP